MTMPARAQSFEPSAATTRQLRDAFGRFATGVTVVTTGGRDHCVGMTANSFSSVSMDPPLVLWSPARASARHAAFAGAEHFAIHVLSNDQAGLAWSIAKSSTAFLDYELTLTPEGIPVLEHCLARFDCRRYALHEAGDHSIIIGEVIRATMRDGAPLAFYGGKQASLAIS